MRMCHLVYINWKTSERRHHSVGMVLPSLDSLSVTTFSSLGMCQALRVTSFREHQVRILERRGDSRPKLMPPFLFI